MARVYRNMPSQERLKELFNYNPDTGVFTRRVSRRRWKEGDVVGTEAGGYININVDYMIYRAHRIAWMYMTGKPPMNGIDHINGNGMDNRWCNLRDADQSLNLCNKQAQSNSKTGIKGVYLLKDGTYKSSVCFRGKTKYLGNYQTVQEAKAARDAAAKVIHGDFFKS